MKTKPITPKFYYCQIREEERPMCKQQCEHCAIYYAPLEKQIHKNILQEDKALYKIYQDKESNFRASLNKLFDFYSVGRSNRSRIASLCRKVSTMKNLKKNVGSISDLEQAISDAQIHHDNWQYANGQLIDTKTLLQKLLKSTRKNEPEYLQKELQNIIKNIDTEI